MAKILVVDDRSFIRQLLLTLLGYSGHTLFEASNGAIALDVAKAERPDLVITDLLMPVMDGFEFTKRLRADPAIAATPVIFYTATYREPEAKALAASCGVRTVLPKPSEPQVILAAVDRELGLTSPIPQDLIPLHPTTTAIQEVKRLDGKLAWYADEMRSAKASLDSVLGKLADGQTEREQMVRLSTQFADNFSSLQRLSSNLTSIIEVTLEASPERGPASVVEAFFDAAIKMIGSRYAAVVIVGKASKKVEHVFVKGIDPAIFADDATAGGSLLKELMAEHSSKRIPGLGRPSPGLPANHPRTGAFLGNSVASRDWIHGFIYFANDTIDGDFSDEDERIVGTIAAEIAIFYENATLHDSLQRHAAQLQVEIARREKAENDMRERERQLAHAQKMEAIGQLTGGIAHDFNNLLTVVTANAEDMHAELDGMPALQHQAAMMLKAADRGAQLVRQLLAYARKQELRPRLFDVNTIFDSFVHMLRRTFEENIALKVALTERLPLVNADQSSLENVLLNLAVNARDAMPSGGTIIFETAHLILERDGEDQNAGVPAGEYVVVSVTDTGSGMPPEVVARAFEPFFTTKEVGKGTGLGLSMVYGFATQSGGQVKIVSAQGRGTSIKVYLPSVVESKSVATTAPVAPVQAVANVKPAERRRILLVEDDDLVRASVTAKLERLGYAVSSVTNPVEALERLEKSQDVDLIFTDVIMPGEMTGADLARAVQAKWPQIKILATSGYTENTLGKVQLPEGVRLLSKPYANKDLTQMLTAVFSGERA